MRATVLSVESAPGVFVKWDHPRSAAKTWTSERFLEAVPPEAAE